MSAIVDHLNKLREERLAREKARIEKLRELNLKKYNKNDPTLKNSISNKSIANKSKSDQAINNTKANNLNKNNVHMNGIKRPNTTSIANKTTITENNHKPKLQPIMAHMKTGNYIKNNIKPTNPTKNHEFKPNVVEKNLIKLHTTSNNNPKTHNNKPNIDKIESNKVKTNYSILNRKSVAPKNAIKPALPKTSMQPLKSHQSATEIQTNRESVFDRLYKPKVVAKKPVDEVKRLQTDVNYQKKLLRDSGLIVNKRHTVFDVKTKVQPPVRRSISAVHFKRIRKSEINNCIHKWSSIGEKLNSIHVKEVNEDDTVKEDKVVSAIKSERKKVKFQTPVPFNFNTPKPEELQSKLKSWLQKRGKSLESYHHLQCFGIHHLAEKSMKPFQEPPKFDLYDDENKENIELDSDSDDDSYTENMNEPKVDLCNGLKSDIAMDMWRRASYVSDSADLNETQDTTMTSGEVMNVHHVDEVLLGVLNDLNELLREGFDWEQCARWLRVVRERFSSACETAAYWECRAALEDRRGDLPASVQCWEEAIAKGTECSVVEANLDNLLDKFMQLKISPNSSKKKLVDPKMLDVKNVFKSTIIRFAVQQAKLKKSNISDTPKYTVTPVRRSARLSTHWSAKRTPLQICTTIHQAGQMVQPIQFVPNEQLIGTP
ncbi:uncharacterized protein DDB_G0284459-like [Achroia grisella]|uniref:uncharacterized protein DDB_G0284459-like n=1 Tax=Achroia grisella TaxID=688607 RepID=UPI0027D31D71|nr:uncharacterized protein DDB_G0284459-like [Achroia grisella]